ncbi:UDP-glycosyltransferase 85A8-like [Lactuca sativa]|uniref:UDP-glycosyltransferase 85A8-like n=1 Tax=Lactuca sativa TaxID=4236 RepID=UPI0022AED824|nr:UDP-glycosyltransferase 85A8-like [Lactuca sativa]
MQQHIENDQVKHIGSNLWKEDESCISWLDTKDPGSVVYVNFGSITVMTKEQLIEFGWGLANSKKDFLWITRPDIVGGNEAMMPPEFVDETKGRGMVTSWCPQEQFCKNLKLHRRFYVRFRFSVISRFFGFRIVFVHPNVTHKFKSVTKKFLYWSIFEGFKHPTIGAFLTHSGWNSIIESISSGVPVICWPFFAEQQTNCRYSCVEWGIGMEIDSNVKREEVEAQVREMMDGKKGKMIKCKALESKKKAEEAIAIEGSSYLNFDKLVTEVLLRK